jgi:hypothetical protein
MFLATSVSGNSYRCEQQPLGDKRQIKSNTTARLTDEHLE